MASEVDEEIEHGGYMTLDQVKEELEVIRKSIES